MPFSTCTPLLFSLVFVFPFLFNHPQQDVVSRFSVLFDIITRSPCYICPFLPLPHPLDCVTCARGSRQHFYYVSFTVRANTPAPSTSQPARGTLRETTQANNKRSQLQSIISGHNSRNLSRCLKVNPYPLGVVGAGGLEICEEDESNEEDFSLGHREVTRVRAPRRRRRPDVLDDVGFAGTPLIDGP